MRERALLPLVPAFGLALLVNALLFGVAGLLTGERPLPEDFTEPVTVQLLQLEAPEPPVKETPPPPEKPQPRVQPDFEPELPPLSPSRVDAPGVALDITPGSLGTVPTGDLVFVEAELDRPPRAIVRTVEYPYRARQRGIEGTVRVKLLVRRDGGVDRVEILDAEPEGVFEDAVRRAATGWRFEPGQIAGEAVDAWVVTTVSFQMNSR